MFTPKKRTQSGKITVTEIDLTSASSSSEEAPATPKGAPSTPATPKVAPSTPASASTTGGNRTPSTPSARGKDKYSSEEVRAALTEFYKRRDATKLSTVENFVLWINSNGLVAFNDLLYIKYGESLSIGTCSAHEVQSRGSISIITGADEQANWTEWLKTVATSNLMFIALLVVFLGLFLHLYGHLALTNLILFVAGAVTTLRHLDPERSSPKVLSPVLYVFWSLISFFAVLESILPESLRTRWEYTILKCVLFVYLYLPERLFKEQRASSSRPVIRVQLVTIVRDLALFFIEAALLFYFTRHDGQLHRYEAACLVLIAAVYLFATRSLKKRDMVVEELYTSEAQYAAHLGAFKANYVPALAQVVPPEEMDLLTRHFESIATLSELLSNELHQAMTKDRVGPAMERFVPFLQMYAPYCADHETKRELLSRLRERKEVSETLDQVLRSGSSVEGLKVQSIESYLIMPVQRVPRYVLLLNEIIKQTPKWHFDIDTCIRALEQVEGVARFIDDAIAARAVGKALPVSPVNRALSVRLNINRTSSTSSTASASVA